MLKRKIGLMVIALLMVAGCATLLTPEQQTLWAINVYNAQYDLYLDQVLDPSIVEEDRQMLMENPKLITDDMIRPDLSDAEKKILREKKKVLVELFPIINTAAALHKSGGNLDANTQKNLTELINRLIALVED